jgi:hypothetical protein
MATPSCNNSAEAPMQYPYQPISSTAGQPLIRLLEVFPGLPEDPLLGTFASQPLTFAAGQGPFWIAVSYAWERQTPCESLSVDDHDLPITSNVAQIVRDLRETGRTTVLWIDAVCINQADAIEKVSQLRVMRDIYEKAKEVVIWLRLPEQVAAPNLVIASQWLRDKIVDQSCAMPTLPLESAFRHDHPNLEWDAPFHKLTKSEWFQRVWIIQEAVVAKNLVFRLGDETITWDSLCSATLRFLSGYHIKRAITEDLDQAYSKTTPLQRTTQSPRCGLCIA